MIKPLIVAVDESRLESFKKIIDCLDSELCMVKIGSVSFNLIGYEAIAYTASKGFGIFLDLKLHDIPNTVKKSIEGLISLPIDMMTIHTSGGIEMMKAAVKAAEGTNIKIFGVTILTSLSELDSQIIFNRNLQNQINAMLDLSEEAGIDGVVCSPHELEFVVKRKSLQSITPGIRITKSTDDQTRVMTPDQAIKKGSDFLVIGRPITAASNIKATLEEISKLI